MKKFIMLLTCVILLALFPTIIFSNNSFVSTLEERINVLWLTNCFTSAQIEDMDRQFVDAFYQGWPSLLKGLKATGKMKTESDEEEYQYQLNMLRPHYEDGIFVSLLYTRYYTQQYADNGKLFYLFDSSGYWSVSNDRGKFTEEGVYISNAEETLGNHFLGTAMTEEAAAFLRNPSEIDRLITAKGETTVSDIRIIALSRPFTFLYVRCDEREYLCKLVDHMGYGEKTEMIPQIELFQLYTAAEVMEAIALTLEQEDAYGRGLAEQTTLIKPTYEAEGEALMADGVIAGNEEGLDPLKPLSRIEATTILVRALGYENEQTQEVSEFSDIPEEHWGKKYANIAKDKGITMGVGDGKFAPDDLVTSTQFAAFLLRNSEIDAFDWEQAIPMLIEDGILTQEQANRMDLFTRGDMTKIIYEAREKGLI